MIIFQAIPPDRYAIDPENFSERRNIPAIVRQFFMICEFPMETRRYDLYINRCVYRYYRRQSGILLSVNPQAQQFMLLSVETAY